MDIVPWSDPHGFFTAAGLAANKNMLIFGVGMVAEKIRSDPNYRMWATIIAFIGTLLVPLFALLFSMNNSIGTEVEKQLKPVNLNIEHLQEFHDYGARYSRQDAEKDKVELRSLIDDCRDDAKESRVELKSRLKLLEIRSYGASRFEKQGLKMEHTIELHDVRLRALEIKGSSK